MISPRKISIIGWDLTVVPPLLLAVAPSAWPQAFETQPSSSELAEQPINPVTGIWSLQFPFNNFQLENDEWTNKLLFQFVLPVSLTKDVSFITRPVISLCASVPHPRQPGKTTWSARSSPN
jgi:hypothetical protein